MGVLRRDPGRGESGCAARSFTSTVSRWRSSTSRCPTTSRSASSRFRSTPPSAILREELAMHGVQVERGVRAGRIRARCRRRDRHPGRRRRRADGAGGLPRRRRRSAQRRAQGARVDVRGRGVRGAVHARRRRGGLVDAARATASGRCTRPTAETDDLLVVHPAAGPRRATGCRCWCPTSWPRPRPPVASRTDSRAPAAGAAPHPGGDRPTVPGADHGAKPAVVVGVSDQPPHRRRLRPRPGVRRRRCRAHPSADRCAGHEHRHPGRPQPGVEACAGASRLRRARAAWTATTPSGGPIGEEVVGRTVRSAREGIGADSTDVAYVIRREAQLLIDYAGSPHRRIRSAGRPRTRTRRA